uniref:Peptidase family M13 containing protein n=1 Tax=Wuchereria bancrofti TaxID=6293 RepID=A0A1I8F0B1_WUCBA
MKNCDQNGSIWNNRNSSRRCIFRFTCLEIGLLVFSSILLSLLIGVSSLWIFAYQNSSFPSSVKRDLFEEANLLSVGIDESALHHNGYVDPCDDFYEYACGNYPINRHLPSNKAVRHTLSDMQNRLNKQIRKLLQAPVTDADKPWNRLAKQYYQKCLNEEELEATGASSMRKLLRDLGGWPVLEGRNWKPWDNSWEKQLAHIMNRTGVNAIILELAVSHDPLNSSKFIIEVDQPKWGVGSRWPYLGGIDDLVIQNYTSLMVQTAINIGADPTQAKHDMKKTIEFELRLVNFSADEMTRRNPERGNNRFQLWQLGSIFPHIDLITYIHTMFGGLEKLSPNDTVIIREPEYFRRIQEVMRRSSKQIIANYVLWRVIQGYSPFLSPVMREPFYAFKANQTGLPSIPVPDRWEDCVFLATVMIDMPVGRLYVANHFDQLRSMKKMNDLTKHFKNELIKQLQTVDWMDEETRRRAPETTADESLLEFTIRIKCMRITDELMRLKKFVDTSIWFQGPAQVDAYYAPNLNEMIFPAGILQFPFMSPGVPSYITYAMVGAVIGHEVSHAFDDQGGRFDEYGNLHNWWDVETARKFYEKTECFIKQYNAVKVEEAGVHLNGQLSVGENIADNAGVKTAFIAYKSWVEENSRQEAALPGFQNMTSTQMFFLAYANNWCSLIRPKHYLQIIMADVHAPSKYRAIIPLQNRPEFSEAFHCPKGSPMNPVKKCSIW